MSYRKISIIAIVAIVATATATIYLLRPEDRDASLQGAAPPPDFNAWEEPAFPIVNGLVYAVLGPIPREVSFKWHTSPAVDAELVPLA